MMAEELQNAFRVFQNQCVWLQASYDMFCDLYHSGEQNKATMRDAASIFFSDLNHILREYFILQVCRLTDPEKTMGRENLTVKYINKLLEAEGKLNPEIVNASKGIEQYRNLVKESRNRGIVHADKEVILAGFLNQAFWIGEHSNEDIQIFFNNLQNYVNEVGEAIGLGPFDIRHVRDEGDALTLISVLKKGLRK